ncbi:MAG: serine hydrolase [Gammaproteobacteria bacterium]|jgi:hypothetical protein|nr:serine hydrolase [Gammaproteobacteria bacterium]MDP7455912.1 serine hydrolase [Gammaproteobacteria bacterium]
MKKFLLGFVASLAVLIGVASLAGFPPAYLYSAPAVASGIGAKLLCSARYVTGFSQQQAFDDLVQYSPILELLTFEFDEPGGAVTTSLLGLSEKTATYLSGMGCAIDYAGFGQRAAINTNTVGTRIPTTGNQAWPLGDTVSAPDVSMQSLLATQVQQDNTLGLNTRALLVLHESKILAEAYAQGTDETTPLLGWSMAKSLNSIMLGNLELRGKLDLNNVPGFPTWGEDARSQIRISDMLTMTDGLAFSEEYNPGDDATAMLFTVPSTSSYVMEKQAQHAPGTFFNYSSGTANLLSRLYQETLGSPQDAYDDYLTNIFDPLGFQNAIFEVDASGVFVGSSYFYASARDWARIGQLMLNRGIINGQRLVSEDWIDRATRPNNSENQRAYGYQWWLNRGNENLRWRSLPEDAFSAQGNRQQYLMVIPSLQLVIIRLGWTAGRYPVNEQFAEIVQQVGR